MFKRFMVAAVVLTVSAGPAVAQSSLRAGQQVSGALAGGDRVLNTGELYDSYDFEGRRGQQITVRMTSSDFDAYVGVTGHGLSEANDDASDDDSDSVLTVTLPEDGTYQIMATSYAAKTFGDYRLSIDGAAPAQSAQAGSAGAIILGQTYSGRLEKGDGTLTSGEYEDVWTISGRRGQQLDIRLSSSNFDPYVLIRGPGGLSEDNDDAADDETDSRLLVTLPEDGEYRITATSYEKGEQGAYQLQVLNAGTATASISGSDDSILAGQTRAGRLEASDGTLQNGEYRDVWTFNGRRGQQIDVQLSSSAFDAYVFIRGPGGLSEDNDDAAGGGSDSRLRVTLPEDGEYRITATSYEGGERGAYQLAVTDAGSQRDASNRADNSAAQDIAFGQTQSGRLEDGDRTLDSGEFRDIWTFNGRRGQQIEVRMNSSAFDPYVAIRGPGDLSAFNDDDPNGGSNSRLVVTLPEDGAYQIIATSYEKGEHGAYQLAVLDGAGATSVARAPTVPPQNQAAEGGLIQVGQAVGGSLGAGDETLQTGEYVDEYRFVGQRGQRVRVELTSSAFDAYTVVRMPSGEQTDNDDGEDGTDSRLDMVLPEDGEYHVLVTSYEPGETGSYRFTVGAGQEPPRQASVQGGARVYALMVGVSDYAGAAPNLAYTDQDALKLAEELGRDGSLNAGSVTLVNADATVGGVRAAFQRIAAQAGPDDSFLFFFSGHGNQTQVPVTGLEPDGKSESIVLRDGEITDAEMGQLFESLHTRLAVLALDSCFSGGFARNVVDRPGVMGMFSSEEDLTSAVAGKFQAGGYLSHFLREGMSGQADSNSDGLVTAGELATYLRHEFRVEVEDVESVTQDGQRNYQNLVIDRGGVQVDDVIVRLPPSSVAAR